MITRKNDRRTEGSAAEAGSYAAAARSFAAASASGMIQTENEAGIRKEWSAMNEPNSTLAERLAAALAEIEELRGDKLRLQRELVRLRGLLRGEPRELRSTKLNEALRE